MGLISNIFPFRNVCIVSIGTIAVNGLGHILAAIFLWKYNPGFLTSVFLFAPYCYHTLDTMIQNGYILPNDIGISLLYGIICHLPLQMMTLSARFQLIQEWQMIIIYLLVLLLINLTHF